MKTSGLSLASSAIRSSTTSENLALGPRVPSRWWGVGLSLFIAILALGLGHQWPIIGAPVFGILLGMLVRNTIGVGVLFTPGTAFASKKMLQWSIIALGFGLSLPQVMRTGLDSLAVTSITVTVAFLSAFVLGKILRIPEKLGILIGVGTAICGGSAIAAVNPIIKPEEHETALAISTIFIFNVAAVLTFPFLGHVLHMSDLGFGVWAGTAINDTSSVVAAAYSFSNEAGDHATIVKLTRAMLIVPICLVLTVWQIWRFRQAGHRLSIQRMIPWFILLFVLASAVRSADLVPVSLLEPIRIFAHVTMVLALSAIGLSSDLKIMRKAGLKPALLGAGVWLAVAVSSLVVQYLTGAW